MCKCNHVQREEGGLRYDSALTSGDKTREQNASGLWFLSGHRPQIDFGFSHGAFTPCEDIRQRPEAAAASKRVYWFLFSVN